MSSLRLEGYHVLITGAAGDVGREAVGEFLKNGCKVTAQDITPIPLPISQDPNLFSVTGDVAQEESIAGCIDAAVKHFGAINILICIGNDSADVTSDSEAGSNIWETPVEVWERSSGCQRTVRGTFLTIKHFLRSVSEAQTASGRELENVSIVVAGSEEGQFGLVRRLKSQLGKLNSRARINAVSSAWDGPASLGGREDGKEGKKVAAPWDLACAMAVLASHEAAVDVNRECHSRDGNLSSLGILGRSTIPASITTPKRRVLVLLSVDFDAVSGFLGTGASPTNGLADFSSGYFAAQVGVPRLLRLFQKHNISSSVTWFVPGHSMESFPEQTKAIVDSGAEIGCHGYAHEGAVQMTEKQERDVIERCVQLAMNLTGKKPLGWRAPLYQLREHTVKVLEEFGFLYDTSLTHHDSSPYFLVSSTTPAPIDFSPSVAASSWMHPLPSPPPRTPSTLVEIPCNWYMEDMTPMQFLPAAANSHGFVSPEIIEKNWKARFEYLYNESIDGAKHDFVFPLILHPDTSGMAHVIGMIDRVVAWLKGWEGVEFVTFGECAAAWKAGQ